MKVPPLAPSALAFVFGALSASAQNLITDTVLNASDYFGTHVTPADPLNYSYVDYFSSAGNDSMFVDHIHEVERDEFTNEPVAGAPSMPELQTLFLYQPLSYNPSVSGAIGTLDFSIDYRTNDPFSEIAFFIQNGGGFGSTAGFTTPIVDGEWHTLEVLGLNSTDFLSADFEGNTTLRFGFGFYSSAEIDPFGIDGVDYQIEVDNFIVTMNPVPEPSSLFLVAGGALTLLSRRSRRSLRS